MRSWHVHPVDIQAKPETNPDSRYCHGTQIKGEEWYVNQTIIRHSSSWGDRLERAGGYRLGPMQMVCQTQSPGSSIMHMSLRQAPVSDLVPDMIGLDADTPWDEDDLMKYRKHSMIPSIPTWVSTSRPRRSNQNPRLNIPWTIVETNQMMWWGTTLPMADIPLWLIMINGNAKTTAWPTKGAGVSAVEDLTEQRNWIYQYFGILPPTMPLCMTIGAAKLTTLYGRGTPVTWSGILS